MLKVYAILWAAFVSMALPLAAQMANSDVEMWNEVDVSGPLTSRATLTVPLVIRNSFSLPNPQLAGLGPVVDVGLTQNITVTGGYLFVALPRIGPGFYVHVPLAAVTVRTRFHGVELADRSRAEGLVGIPNDPIRYRNRLVIQLPSHSEQWLAFLTDEVFYDFSQNLWSQNRFQAGIGRQISKQVRADVFYLNRNVHHTSPTTTHAIGVTLEVHLTRQTRRRGVPNEEN